MGVERKLCRRNSAANDPMISQTLPTSNVLPGQTFKIHEPSSCVLSCPSHVSSPWCQYGHSQHADTEMGMDVPSLGGRFGVWPSQNCSFQLCHSSRKCTGTSWVHPESQNWHRCRYHRGRCGDNCGYVGEGDPCA